MHRHAADPAVELLGSAHVEVVNELVEYTLRQVAHARELERHARRYTTWTQPSGAGVGQAVHTCGARDGWQICGGAPPRGAPIATLDNYVKSRNPESVIRSDTELEEIRTKLDEQEARVVAYRLELEKDGLPSADIERALEPVRAFATQLRETIDEYERVREGGLPSISSLEDLGPALVAARIAAGVTQRELAVRLGVHESQVSRDERNDYSGVSLERAAKLLNVIGVSFRGTLSLLGRPDTEGRRL